MEQCERRRGTARRSLPRPEPGLPLQAQSRAEGPLSLVLGSVGGEGRMRKEGRRREREKKGDGDKEGGGMRKMRGMKK